MHFVSFDVHILFVAIRGIMAITC